MVRAHSIAVPGPRLGEKQGRVSLCSSEGERDKSVSAPSDEVTTDDDAVLGVAVVCSFERRESARLALDGQLKSARNTTHASPNRP